MEEPMSQIRALYAKGDPRERQKIQEQLRDLQRELYTDWELLFSIACGVSLTKSPIHPKPKPYIS